jgi:hypothetical protein
VENIVYGGALVEDDARLWFHGDDLEGADGIEVAEAAVGYGADATGAASEETSERGFGYGGGIAAEFPAAFAGVGFERA